MRRLRLTVVTMAVTLGTLLIVGSLLAQGAPTTLVQAQATVLATPGVVPSGASIADRERSAYLTHADRALGDALQVVQAQARTAASAGGTATPTAGLTVSRPEVVAPFVQNMRDVVRASERGLEDLDFQLGENTACPTVTRSVRDAEAALRALYDTLVNDGTLFGVVEPAVLNQVTQAQTGLRVAMTCVAPAVTPVATVAATPRATIGVSVGTAVVPLGTSIAPVGTSAPALATPRAVGTVSPVGTVAPVATAGTPRAAASGGGVTTGSSGAAASSASISDAVNQAIQQLQQRIDELFGRPTASPTR